MITAGDRHKLFNRAQRRAQGIGLRGRLRRVGTKIVDGTGAEVILRGYNYGEDMLWAGEIDFAADKAAGANCVRIVFRGWGGNALPKLDGQDDGAFGDYSDAQWTRARAMLAAAKAHGLYVIAAFDSDCGQNGWQGMDAVPPDPTQWNFCTIVDGLGNPQSGQNFFTPLGQDKRRRHINHQRIFLRVFNGLIDIVEPLVEPNPLDTGHGQRDVNEFYVECMASNLIEDPGVLHAIGGFSYRWDVIGDPMAYGTVWPTDQIILTWDFLDSSMSNTDAQFAIFLANVTSVRTSTGYPCWCNQFGIQLNSDPDCSILQKRINSLRDATGGPLGWNYWEKISKVANSYGPFQDDSDFGTNRSYANNGPAKQVILENGFKGIG